MAATPMKPTAARPAKAPKADKSAPAKAARPGKVMDNQPDPTDTDAPSAARSDSDVVRLKDLVDTVSTATGLKKSDAKKAVEAALAGIATALAAKSVLVAPPLGKLRVAKANGSVLTLKLRLADASGAKGLALAQDGEDS